MMFKSFLRPALLASAVALAACATPSAPVSDSAAPAALSSPGPAWPQATSDVPADPAVRFGTLPNGMRYALMRNATPPGQASLRLRIDAGSLMEAEDQRGLAHFIEHMAFNGTTDVPEGDLLPILQRLGLAFGPDTNAFTSFDQTVYQLDLPRTDAATVDTGLMILRQMAGEATLTAEAIDRERGIVLSEERTRASPAYRVALARYAFLMPGQLAPERFPIGDVEVLANAPRERFAAFYETFYRPERATLVAVGDFDIDEMEAKVRAEFSDWANAAPDGVEPALGEVRPRQPEARVVVEPGIQPSLTLVWVSPPSLETDTQAERRRNLVRYLGFAVLNRRLERLSRSDDPPFVAASAYRSTVLRSQDVFQLAASLQPGRWREALAALETQRRLILDQGVSQAELDREIAEQTAAYQTYVAGAGTRRTPGLADSLIETVNEDEVFSSPADEFARFQATVAEVTPDMVEAALTEAMAGDGPLVFAAVTEPIEGGEAAVMSALVEAQATPLATTVQEEVIDWPYSDFGEPGRVAERDEIEDLGVTTVRFENGVRLTIKPTDFREDQVLVAVNIGGGLAQLPSDEASPTWAAATALVEGGLGRISREDLEAALASRVFGSDFDVGEDAFALRGSTRPEDLETQLQVLAAYVVDPAFRPAPFERIRTVYRNALAQLESTPGGVFSREAGTLLHGGDSRWRFPSAEAIAAAQPAQVSELLRPILLEAPLEVVIVGDVDAEAAVAAVASTFGALPPRGGDPALNVGVRLEGNGETVGLTHSGRSDQGLGFLAWATAGSRSDLQRSRALSLLAAVMRLRLVEELREGQAVTYSPSAGSTASWIFPDYGYVSAAIEAPPERLDGFFADVERIAAELRDTPVSEDDLERARRPVLESLSRARNTNEYWLGQLEDIQTDPMRLTALRTVQAELAALTPEDLQGVARTYLRPERSLRVVVTPHAQ